MLFRTLSKILHTFLFLFIIISYFTPSHVYALETPPTKYTSLVGLPIIATVQDGNMAEFVNYLVQWTIAIAAALAVIMIVIGGLERMTLDSIQKQTDGTKRIQAAVWGLLIALTSYLLLYTINPKLVNLNIIVDTVKTDQQPGGLTPTPGGAGGTTPTTPGTATPTPGTGTPTTPETPPTTTAPTGDVIEIPPGITIGGNSNNTIDSSLVPKLSQLDSKLDAAGINWRVTEAYPPKSQAHKATCHYNATCIDANFDAGTPSNAANINKFINSASESGLIAVYEVTSQSVCQLLKQNGVKNVLYVSHATGAHFSVYSTPPRTTNNC